MRSGSVNPAGLFGAVVLALLAGSEVCAQGFSYLRRADQESIRVRDPSQLPHAPLPDGPAPSTVSRPQSELPARNIALDEAIRLSLGNSTVVRVLTGVKAVSSGRTVYDTGITNTDIAQQRARFDPQLNVENYWSRTEQPNAVPDPLHPGRSLIAGLRSDDYRMHAGVSKQNVVGGEARVGVNANPTRVQSDELPLNPYSRSSLEFSYNQPLLQGGGMAVNLAPIVLARIQTERSYFQFKDAMQENIRGVIAGYWLLVEARTNLWARQQQVEQAAWANRLADAEVRIGTKDARDASQAAVSLANFRAGLIAAQGAVLLQETALRNILGLPPTDGEQFVPVSPPSSDRLDPDWRASIALAEERRPDLVELKLIIEADQQLLLQSRNQALPRTDAVALYRWNGLEGEMPVGDRLRSEPGAFADWSLGVNFSVPLGLRQARAGLRRTELLISRDRANLEQGVHAAVHELAITVRNLAQYYDQYNAYREMRIAAERNQYVQKRWFEEGRNNYLYVLLAITDWGNAISSEAHALMQYNTELATLERQTGTILETHGVSFYEERFGSLGPLGRLHDDVCYPSDFRPTENTDRYPTGEQPSENSFRLRKPETPKPAPAPRNRLPE